MADDDPKLSLDNPGTDPSPANENIKQTRFWVDYLPVNDAYVAMFGDNPVTASQIPLRYPDIPALGKKTWRGEQRSKEQTFFSSLDEIDSVLQMSGLFRDPETNEISSVEPTANDPRPTDPSVLEKGLMASDIGSRVAGDIRDLKKPPPGQQLVPKEKPPAKGQMFRGIGSLMRGRISPIVTAAQLFWGEMPDSVKDDAGAMVNWLRENKMHELVGLDKPGIEYFKQALTPTAQEPKGIMSLPPMLQSGEFDWDYDSDTLGERVKVRHGTPSPEIKGGRFDIGEFSLKEAPLGQGAAMKGTGLYSAQAVDVAGDYFDKEPKGRVLLNNKLLPKDHNIPLMSEEPWRAEEFAKDFGVDVEDVDIISNILKKLKGEMPFGDTTDTSLDYVLRNAERLVLENTKKAREARKFVEVHLPDERVYPGRIFSQERSAEVLERSVADNLRLIEVMNKYNLKGTPGALVEFAYHPEDWKNMIDLDMKLSDQPEILEKVLQMPSVKLLMEDNLPGLIHMAEPELPGLIHMAEPELPGLIHMAEPESIRQLDGADRLSEGFASLGQEWLVTRYLDGQELSMDLLQVIARDTNSERQAKIILAKEFADAGIPGNKYFDQHSRYASPPSEPEEDTRTKNAVVWDQKAMDRATRPTVLEGGFPPRRPKMKADGGLVDKPLYEQPRMVG
jgi:hypothetical protein